MASESTAIHDLLAGLQRKPLPEEPDDDLLFAGSKPEPRDDAPLARPPRGTHPPRMFEPMPSAIAADPFAAPYASQAIPARSQPPAAAGVQQGRGPMPHVVVPLPQPFMKMPAHALAASHAGMRRAPELSNKKIYAIAGGLFIVIGVLLGVYLSGDDAPAPASGDRVTMPVAAAAPASEPAAEPAAAAAPATEDVAVAPTVTPIEPVEPVVPVAEPAGAPVVRSDELSVPPPAVPASAFEARHEPTLPTIPTAAPSVAPDEPAPAVAAAAAPARTAPAAKKSRRQLAREQRAAKRASKRAPSKSVARAEPVARTQKATPDTKLDGNGALAITSAEPREVWVDGRNSRRMTPLRVLLKPGKHKVTLFDKSRGHAKTYEVEIKANETTKLAK